MKSVKALVLAMLIILVATWLPMAVAAEDETAPTVETTAETTEATTDATTDATEATTVETTVAPTVEPTVEVTEEPTVAPTEPDYPGGMCGTIVCWKIVDGVLSISGTGEMRLDSGTEPWDDYRKQIHTIAVNNGVTKICDHAFGSCQKATKLTISNSVKYIGEYAFSGCYSLNSVSLGTGITTIGQYAFRGCDSISSITIPRGVSEIGWGVFSDCGSLKKVDIHSGVKTIGTDAFSSCVYLTSFVIPDTVTRVDSGAFSNCFRLSGITIGKGISKIESNTFAQCSALTDVTIPDNVKEIAGWAFSGCSSLKNVRIGKGVTKIGYGAFDECNNMKSFIVSSGNSKYSSDSAGFLYNKAKTELILCPRGYSGRYTIASTTSRIANHAFYSCNGVTGVTFPGGLKYIGEYAFAHSERVSNLVFPASLTEIDDYAFFCCYGLNSVTFRGNAPRFTNRTTADIANTFDRVTLMAYYPRNNATWTNGVLRDYGGNITWIAQGDTAPVPPEETTPITTDPLVTDPNTTEPNVTAPKTTEPSVVPGESQTNDASVPETVEENTATADATEAAEEPKVEVIAPGVTSSPSDTITIGAIEKSEPEGNGGIIIAVCLIVLAGAGGVAGFFYMRKRRG